MQRFFPWMVVCGVCIATSSCSDREEFPEGKFPKYEADSASGTPAKTKPLAQYEGPAKSQLQAVAAIQELSGTVVIEPNSQVATEAYLFFYHDRNAGENYFPLRWSVPPISDASLGVLRSLPTLKKLGICGMEVRRGDYCFSDDGLSYLHGLKNLRQLTFINSQFSDAGMKHIAGLKQLGVLDLHGTVVTEVGLAELSPLTDLKSLRLPFRATDACMTHMKSFRQLESLDIRGSSITDAGLSGLAASLPRLTTLVLNENITDAGLKHVQSLSRLTELNLDGSRVTDAGIEKLQALPQLKRLTLFSTAVTDVGLIHLKAIKNLESLNLCGTRVTEGGVMDIHRVFPDAHISAFAASPWPRGYKTPERAVLPPERKF